MVRRVTHPVPLDRSAGSQPTAESITFTFASPAGHRATTRPAIGRGERHRIVEAILRTRSTDTLASVIRIRRVEQFVYP
ncbi:hypothetical protein ACFFWD_37575 [Bradyrhizobium erythrophlei]|uniref:hypothetical protein n=1 Tax=Bradyrhizobium erythrophlei TaxID=1437360 RepID=UPI0035EED7CD